MSDRVLQYFNDEIRHFQEQAKEFGSRHKDVAKRLSMDGGRIEDPHVRLLVESFSLIAARLRIKIDDEFSRITDGLLQLVAPHLAAPWPAATIIQAVPQGPIGAMPASGQLIPSGTRLNIDVHRATKCTFSTCADITLLPIAVVDAALFDRPPTVPLPERVRADRMLRIRIKSLKGEPLCRMTASKLRFYVETGSGPASFQLLQLLVARCRGVSVRPSQIEPTDQIIETVAPGRVVPVGFRPEEMLLPPILPRRQGTVTASVSGSMDRSRGEVWPTMALPGLRLLTEYACFPRKFQFFDVCDVPLANLANDIIEADIIFWLDRGQDDLARDVHAGTFRLGCAPAVNLFLQETQPDRLRHEQVSQEIIPSPQAPEDFEIHSVRGVFLEDDSGSSAKSVKPFFGIRRFAEADPEALWWVTRDVIDRASDDVGPSSSLRLTLVNLNMETWQSEARVHTESWLTNAGLSRIIADHSTPKFDSVPGNVGAALVGGISHGLPATSGHNEIWRLVAAMSLRHIPLTDPGASLGVIQELLRLNDPASSPAKAGKEYLAAADALVGVSSKRCAFMDSIGGQPVCIPGWSVELSVNENMLPQESPMLFGLVLQQLLIGFCPINSKLETVVKSADKVLFKCPPMNGSQTLL